MPYFGIRSKCTNIHFACWHCSIGIDLYTMMLRSLLLYELLTYHHSYPWFLELLIEHLCVDINTRKPASITRMRMVPSNCIFQTSNLKQCQCWSLYLVIFLLTSLACSMYDTIYSYASFWAFTRVSVPSTGNPKASIMIIVSPCTLPCIRPITSILPPERACITLIRKSLVLTSGLSFHHYQIPFW